MAAGVTAEELRALCDRARAGDEAARHALLVELYAAVRKHVYLLIGGGALGDDAVQDTMIAVHRGLAKFRGDASPKTWALTIATRTALRARRKAARYVPVEDAADRAIDDFGPTHAAELALLQRALATLAPKKRSAFVLMAIFELSADEAGRALGTFANTAASRFRHARAELETYFSGNSNDESARVAATKDIGRK